MIVTPANTYAHILFPVLSIITAALHLILHTFCRKTCKCSIAVLLSMENSHFMRLKALSSVFIIVQHQRLKQTLLRAASLSISALFCSTLTWCLVAGREVD